MKIQPWWLDFFVKMHAQRYGIIGKGWSDMPAKLYLLK